jgi:hypothetical protein
VNEPDAFKVEFDPAQIGEDPDTEGAVIAAGIKEIFPITMFS